MPDGITLEQAKAAHAQQLAIIKAILDAVPFTPLASTATVGEIVAQTARIEAAISKLED
jgi:hypothetical protein